LEALDTLTDAQARQPSKLPGWSVGHVLTHLARNAESHVRMLQGADRGEMLTQYADGARSRNADIEAGADRSAQELVADVRATIYELEAVWASTTARGWQGRGVSLAGEVPTLDLVFRRWREIEIHRADLGMAYTFADWPTDLVRLDLARMTSQWASRKPMGLADLPQAALALAPNDRLAWLWGRLDVAGLQAAGIS
jgi:maleylpyruvate isomerase